MTRSTRFLAALVILTSTLGSLPCATYAAEPVFSVSVDPTMWSKWGFQYPATYVFRVTGVAADAAVSRRDAGQTAWTPLERKTADDFYSGIECVRFDPAAGKAYVSVGFKTSDTFQLQWKGVASVAFDSVARYYDARKAAYTLSNDNWGCNMWGHPGAPWKGPTDDESDNYRASLHVCRSFHLPLSIAINSGSAGGNAMWSQMQEELDRRDFSWEPVVHGQTHPREPSGYAVRGYQREILGCRQDILSRLKNIPYGQYLFEHILTYGYEDEMIKITDAGQFLFLRGFNWFDNPSSTDYAPWDPKYRFYGIAGLNTKGYDTLFESRDPKGRYFARDVADLNAAFDKVHQSGGIFYALWHPDRYRNSVIHDPRPGVEGAAGSTLVQHLAHVANRKDVWYVANGWLYSYRFVAENARVQPVEK